MRPRSGRLRAAALALAALLLGLVWFWPGRPRPDTSRSGQSPALPPPPSGPTLRVGVPEGSASLPVHALGRLLRQRGLTLTLERFEDPGPMWQLLAAGELDLALSPLDQLALARPRHDPGIVVLPAARSQGADGLAVARSIRGPEDLQGATIAHVPGTAGSHLVISYLSTQPLASYSLIAARTSLQAASWLRTGQVAAAAVTEPTLSGLAADGFPTLWSSRQLPVTVVWVASRQLLQDRARGPRPLQAFTQTWYSLVHRLKTTPGLTVKAIAEETGQPQREVEIALRGVEFLTLEQARGFRPQVLEQSLLDLGHLWSLSGAFQGATRDLSDGSSPVDLGALEDPGLVVDSLTPTSSTPTPVPSPSHGPEPRPERDGVGGGLIPSPPDEAGTGPGAGAPQGGSLEVLEPGVQGAAGGPPAPEVSDPDVELSPGVLGPEAGASGSSWGAGAGGGASSP